MTGFSSVRDGADVCNVCKSYDDIFRYAMRQTSTQKGLSAAWTPFARTLTARLRTEVRPDRISWRVLLARKM
eukprot:15253-Eustigmatos_ZCMA.PRE.1